jgi:CII-binding regulator of phage lambda lysogenization HflD
LKTLEEQLTRVQAEKNKVIKYLADLREKKAADNDTVELVSNVLSEVKKQANEINRQNDNI